MGAGIPALFAEGFFVQVDEVAVETEEEAVVVHPGGLFNVRPDEVVVAGDCARDKGEVGYAREAGEAVDCVDVAKAVGFGKGAPGDGS